MNKKPHASRSPKEAAPASNPKTPPQTNPSNTPVRAWNLAQTMPQNLAPRDVAQLQRTLGNRAVGQLLQRKPTTPDGSGTPLPDTLQQGISALSGMDMSDVRVYHNSDAPDSVGAHAYAQGSNIHIAPGQDRHLPHEAWHVVQQKQGRVAPSSTTLTGVPINDDVGLEREADTMGQRALTTTPTAGQLQQVSLPSGNAPLQGIFKKGKKPGEYIDKTTGDSYQYVSQGYSMALKAPFLVLRRDDGLVVRVRQDTMKVIFEDDEEREYRYGDEKYREPRKTYEQVVNPSGGQETQLPDNGDTDMEDETAPWKETKKIKKAPVMNPRVKKDSYEAVEAWVVKKADSDFVAQVSLVPATHGEISNNPQSELQGEPTYTSSQLWVEDVRVGNKDRPETRYDTQKSHTVAWTLLRAELNAYRSLPLKVAVLGLLRSIGQLQKLANLLRTTKTDDDVEEDELEALWEEKAIEQLGLKLGNAGILGRDMLKDNSRLSITLWQNTLSQLFKLYIQAYQLGKGSTYDDGQALGNAEGYAMERLRTHNAAVAKTGNLAPPTKNKQKQNISAEDEVIEAAGKVLDVKFKRSLKPAAYAFAINHWVQALYMAFPALMNTYGVQIVTPHLNAGTHGKAKKTGASTVAELLTHFGYGDLSESINSVNTMLGAPRVTSSDVARLRIPVPESLDMDFTANADVVNIQKGKLHQDPPPQKPNTITPNPDYNREKSTFSQTDSNGTTSEERNVAMPFYTADQIGIRRLHISDMDRPDTQYGTAQKSHTVAWTLVRAQIRSHAGGTVKQLLQFALSDLQSLKRHTSGTGKTLLKQTVAQLQEAVNASYPTNAWQVLASDVVRRYMVIYQVSESSTYNDGRAVGRGEASHMEVLRVNENSVKHNGQWLHPAPRILEAAYKLLDIHPSKELSLKAARAAYKHWLLALKSSFPAIMATAEKPIINHVLDQDFTKTVAKKYKVDSIREWFDD